MKYAIVKINGSQFRVQEKDQIEVDRLSGKEGESVVLDDVLLFVDGAKVKIGKPLLKDVKVEVKVLKNYLGDKLDIYKFKAKTGYRRKTGFRSQKSLLSIEKIVA